MQLGRRKRNLSHMMGINLTSVRSDTCWKPPEPRLGLTPVDELNIPVIGYQLGLVFSRYPWAIRVAMTFSFPRIAHWLSGASFEGILLLASKDISGAAKVHCPTMITS